METLKDVKELIKLANELDLDKRELFDQMGSDDFEIGNYRFILADDIDRIMQDELSNDPYILGCFNASFLVDIIDWPIEAIEATQKAEHFEAIGDYILDNNYIDELQSEYARLEGYGHHFSHYDHSEREETILGNDYYIFRVN